MLQWAKDWTAGIEIVKNNPLDHDLGFRFMNSFYLGYTLSNDTTDPNGTYRAYAKDVLLTAAGSLNSRFNNGGVPANLIEAVGRNGWLAPYGVVVDSMMNISLLFEGWDLSGRPTSGAAATWYDHAVAHACTILEQNVRSFGPGDPRAADDGSTYHGSTHYDNSTYTPASVRNDPNVWGDLYYKMTAQGYGDETTWSRGQAWSLYGFTQTYSYTRDDANVAWRFLDAACRNANYLISHLPDNYTADPYNHRDGDFVPPTDFDAALGEPNGPWNDADNDKVYGDANTPTYAYVQRDSSAAAIAASGLLQLSTLVTDPNLRALYFDTAEDILRCLMTFDGGDGKLDYLAKDSNHMGILANARGAYGGSGYSMAVADYYFLEALGRYEAIPEPATAAILAAGLALCIPRRWRRRAAARH
jgi:unsaturated chondroitin disaccharide hydrolase